jgi:hypothetical protein
MTSVAEISLVATPDAWRAAGFTVGDDSVVWLGSIRIRLVDSPTNGTGITGWALADAPEPHVVDIDGLATAHVRSADVAPAVVHPNAATSIDHIVVYTPDLERTCAAIEAATGAPLKRIREVGSLRQGFHRLGTFVVEVVSFPGIPAEQAEFWGLALNVADIDAAYALCGDAAMSAPKDAVQRGRRIASFRESVGLGVPVAVMTPHVSVRRDVET